MTEKIINSVDAVLMKECLTRGIDPKSEFAPKSIAEAQKKFFDIREGKLSNIDAKHRSLIAKNIMLVASGHKTNPSYAIIDKGEGQTPKQMPDTLLSLVKSNKTRIQFVQGKYGMGGSGVLRFCSRKHNLQLIISKRNLDIKENSCLLYTSDAADE